MLIARLGPTDQKLSLQERYSEALTLSFNITGDAQMNQKRAQARIAITRVQKLLQKTFLDDAGAPFGADSETERGGPKGRYVPAQANGLGIRSQKSGEA